MNSTTLSKARYQSIIDKIKDIKANVRKEANDYRLLKRYTIVEVNGEEKLISPSTSSGHIKYYVHDDELFDILDNAHISTGHGGRDRMLNIVKSKFKNVTYKDIMLYLSLCTPCSQKQKNQKKGVVKPVTILELNSRCQIDLIDYQSQPDGDYKFVLVYFDYVTKFVILRPLKSKTTSEVCDNIIDIFTLFGAPSVLQSDNAKELVDYIMAILKNVWPNFKLVYGKPRPSESQGCTERENMENMIATWMQEKQTTHWAQGLRFVQCMKNSILRSEIKKSPHMAMFGCPPKRGLAMNSIPIENVVIESEEDLENVIKQIHMEVEEIVDETPCEVKMKMEIKEEEDEENEKECSEIETECEVKVKIEVKEEYEQSENECSEIEVGQYEINEHFLYFGHK